MYSKRNMYVIGFHGCGKSVRDKILIENSMEPSQNDYDWLGKGCYFWENDYDRALSFASEKAKREDIENPVVLGAFIDLGCCLDLLNIKYLKELKGSYDLLNEIFELQGEMLPVNIVPNWNKYGDMILRPLDRLVIEHYADNNPSGTKFDSVRGVFWEGEDLYAGAGMKEKNHIQISVRNIDCIKGFFIPREKVGK